MLSSPMLPMMHTVGQAMEAREHQHPKKKRVYVFLLCSLLITSVFVIIKETFSFLTMMTENENAMQKIKDVIQIMYSKNINETADNIFNVMENLVNSPSVDDDAVGSQAEASDWWEESVDWLATASTAASSPTKIPAVVAASDGSFEEGATTD